MSTQHKGRQSIAYDRPPSILSYAAVVGKKEGEGPLAACFDEICTDSYFGQTTWEKAESELQKRALRHAMDKGGIAPEQLDCIYSGDLLNQCVGSSFALRGLGVPSIGLYGACSTMAESMLLASMLLAGGFGTAAAAMTSSHFATAERQFRTPMEYGGQRTPTAQWTVTGSGAVILTAEGSGPYVTAVTMGRVVDMGIKDVNNMGAAMAPAAYDTLKAHFNDLGKAPTDYDLIVTGDLGSVGRQIVTELFRQDGVEMSGVYNDCGLMIFDLKGQDVHAGGSGCGCSAAVLTGKLLDEMRQGKLNRLLFAGTGSLQSPLSFQQGESIPAVCHAVSICRERSVG